MSTSTSSPSSNPQSLIDPDAGQSQSSDVDDVPFSITIPLPKVIRRSISIISSIRNKVERSHIVPIVIVLCVETAFLKWIRWSNVDVFFALIFSFLFVWPAWTFLNLMHCQLVDVSQRIEALQQSIKSRESTPVPAVLNHMSPLLLREEDFSQTGTPTPDPKSPVERRVGTDRHPYLPYDVIATPEAVTPVAVESLPSSPPPPAQGADRGKGVEIHGIKGNIVGVSNDGTPSGSAKQHSSQPAPTPELASSHWNPGEGIKLEGPMAKIVETSNVGTASSSVEQPSGQHAPAPEPPSSRGDSGEGIVLEGFGDNIIGESNVDTASSLAERPGSQPAPAPKLPSSRWDSGEGIVLEGFGDNIIGESNVDIASSLAERPGSQPAPAPEHPVSRGDSGEGIVLEGFGDNIIGESSVGTASSSAERHTHQPEPIPEPSSSRWGSSKGTTPEGTLDNIDGVSAVRPAGSSTKKRKSQPAPTTEPASSRRLSTLREITQGILQFAEGRFQRSSHSNQSEPSNNLSPRRCAIRLLMSCASLSPADFVSPVGYLGPEETTPYYPTGDLREDRNLAFNIAMDSIDDLEVCLQEKDDVRIATKFSELAQSLSDLGLREYALEVSGFVLDIFERPYLATPNNHRLHVASVLALRANILCDLRRNEEGRDAAERAVTLYKEHQDSQTGPVPELTSTLLNYAVLLTSIGLKDESAGVAFELLGEADESQPDISALCKLCLSNARIGTDDDMALSMAEETMELTRPLFDARSQAVLVGALLNKSKILSSRGQNDIAISVSAEAVTLLRSISTTRPVFTLFLAHALDTHAHHLSEANRKGESYSTIQNAVELWQTLRVSAPEALVRPLAWALFHLAKFRHKGGDKNALREELRIAEAAVDMFREVEPMDTPGLADALYLFGDRMLELDKNQEAATYAEESVLYFRDASSKDKKYALDLIFSLSLASACLACTDRADDAFEYAKEAVEVQHGRMGVEDGKYVAHLQKLLMDVVYRAIEMEKPEEAAPWLQELQTHMPEEGSNVPLARRGGNSQGRGEGDEFKKQTSYWMDANTDAPPKNGSTSSTPIASGSAPTLDKGKGKEVNPPSGLGSLSHRSADEEIISPGAAAAAAAQRRLAGLGNAGPLSGSMFGGGPGGDDLLGGLPGAGGGDGGCGMRGASRCSGMGSRSLGGTGLSSTGGSTSGSSGIPGLRMGGGLGGMGGPATHAGSWSGKGIQSKLNDQDT